MAQHFKELTVYEKMDLLIDVSNSYNPIVFILGNLFALIGFFFFVLLEYNLLYS